MVNDGRYPLSLLINLPGKFRVRRIVQRSREKILWMKNISILLTLYRIESDSLTNPSLFHPFHFDSHICSLLLAITTNENHFYSKGKRRKKKKKRTLNPEFNPLLSILHYHFQYQENQRSRDPSLSIPPFFPWFCRLPGARITRSTKEQESRVDR